MCEEVGFRRYHIGVEKALYVAVMLTMKGEQMQILEALTVTMAKR